MLLKGKLHKKRVLLLILLAVLYGATHIPRLGTDEMNPDALNWHARSEQYVDAIKSRDFMRTYQSYHPGVSLMLITGAPVELLKRVANDHIYNRFNYEIFHFVAKYALNFVLLNLILLAIFFLTRVIGFRIAYFTGLLLTLDTFFLGNARLLHMDTLLALLTLNGLLLFYLFFREQKYLDLALASMFVGFALWTKNVSVLTVCFVLLVLGFMFLGKKFGLKKAFIYGLTVILGLVVAGYLILPALWVDPARVVRRIYKNSGRVVEEGHEEKFFGKVTLDPGPLYYPIVFGYKLTPVVLVVFLVALVLLLKDLVITARKRDFSFLRGDKTFLLYLLLYFAIYFLAVEIAQKKIDRYLVPLFPIIYVIFSYYFLLLLDSLKNKYFKAAAVLLLAVTIIYPVFRYFPYYFVYNSPLFGGPVVAEKVIGQKSFGIGIFEVRDFIIENYGFVPVGFVDRKSISAIYPNSMVYDARISGTRHYQILVLDSDEVTPGEVEEKFVYDKTIKIAGLNFWNFYVKKVQ